MGELVHFRATKDGYVLTSPAPAIPVGAIHDDIDYARSLATALQLVIDQARFLEGWANTDELKALAATIKDRAALDQELAQFRARKLEAILREI